jgi:hypothetical protein
LPVKLFGFTAARKDKVNLLQWSIDKQVNFSHFELERSENGRDFITISKIGFAGSEYSYQDKNFNPTINYYRLKMVDNDGKYEYSPVRRLNNQAAIDISVYPNPAKETLHLRIEAIAEKRLQLQVLSADGKSLQTQKLVVSAGVSITTLNVSALQSGRYFIRISDGETEMPVLNFTKL